MFKPDDTTTVKTVKISAPFALKAYQRLIIVNGKAINIAASAGRQQGDYLYSAIVTLVREKIPTHRTARMRDHALSLEVFNQSKKGD
jgi:phospholipid N-methyltransferase